jgi:Zn-dependent metalloprotease
VDDAPENAFVKSKVTRPVFVGLNDRNLEGAWKWIADNRLSWCGGSGGKPSSSSQYANWARSQPATESCQYKTRNGRGYWFCDSWTDWESARKNCVGAKSTLARIEDAGENAFIAPKVQPSAWIAGTDAAKEGEWRWNPDAKLFWTGGRLGHAIGGVYSHWSQNNPADSTTNNCAMIENDSGGYWYPNWCQAQNAWVCEGSDQDPELPDLHDCATLNNADGLWSGVSCDSTAAFVCETPPPDAGKTFDQLASAVRDDYRSGKPRVSHAEMTASSASVEPFLTYPDRFGLRACVDSLEPKATPRANAPSGEELVDYSQMYKGVPVFGRGYLVHRDATSKAVKTFTGRVEHGLSIDPAPSIVEGNAWSRAVMAAGLPPGAFGGARPKGELTIFEATVGKRPRWELGWAYNMPAKKGKPRQLVVISAKNGSTLGQTSSRVAAGACNSVDVTNRALTTETLNVTAFQQTLWGDRSDVKAYKIAENVPNPYLLYSDGVVSGPSEEADAGPTPISKPRMFAQCVGKKYPEVIGFSSPSITSNLQSGDGELAAGIFTGAQRCLDFYAATLLTTSKRPWIGIDGTGTKPIDIRLYSDPANPNGFFDPDDSSLNFEVNFLASFGTSIEFPCHELSHGVWATFNPNPEDNLDYETAAVNEGFADVLGAAAEMKVRGYPGQGGFCFSGDDQASNQVKVFPAVPVCERNHQNPPASMADLCTVKTKSNVTLYDHCPMTYGTPEFCANLPRCTSSLKVECCEPHAASTVLSHWFYMVSNGENGANAANCGYNVLPIDPDLSKAVPKVAELLFNGLRDGHFADGTGYEGIADATIQAAKEKYGADSTEVQAVVEGWFAAAVKERNFEGTPKVEPPRNAEPVYPWKTFQWPVADNETAWDFQISLGAFDNGPVLFEKTNIESTITKDGKRYGAFDLALPFDSPSRFFWRVRPHTSDEWTDCYSIHSFNRTTQPLAAENVKVLEELESGTGKVFPGQIKVGWDAVEGASSYQVKIAQQDLPDCDASGEIETRIDDIEGQVRGILPKKSYWMSVRPVGPPGFDGKPSLGLRCTTIHFDTAEMRPPTPQREPVFATPYLGTTTIEWQAQDQSVKYGVTFYEMNMLGECSETPAVPEIIVEDSGTGDSRGFRGAELAVDMFSPPNASGYCWEVVGIAADDTRSPPSERRHIVYSDEAVPIGPGDSDFTVFVNGTFLRQYHPAPLPVTKGKTSYGQDITLSWNAPSPPHRIWKYRLKGGLYPWFLDEHKLPTPDPINCITFSGCEYSPEKPFTAEVAGDELTFSVKGDMVPKGRTCWGVYPVLENPNTPVSEEWTGHQPKVIVNPFCYAVRLGSRVRPALDVHSG